MLTQSQMIMIQDMPFLLTPLEKAQFDHHDVIYVILSLEEDGKARLIDVGQSSEAGGAFNDAEHLERWKRHAHGQILVGAHRPASDYNMAEDRLRIITTLRRTYHTPYQID